MSEKKPNRGRQSNAKKNKKSNPATGLIEALKFVLPFVEKTGFGKFCLVEDNFLKVKSANNVVSFPVDADLKAAPDAAKFLTALQKCEQELALTNISETTLVVTSGPFRALIECAQNVGAETYKLGELGERDVVEIENGKLLKAALSSVYNICEDGDENSLSGGVWVDVNSAFSSDGKVLLEYWHGLGLEGTFVVPKNVAKFISEAPYDLLKVELADSNSCTYARFSFENGALLECLFENRNTVPDLQSLFQTNGSFEDIESDFFKAVKIVKLFSEDGNVYIQDGVVSSASDTGEGSTYKLSSFDGKIGFDAEALIAVEHAFQKACFGLDKVVFYGDNIRGVVMALDEPVTE